MTPQGEALGLATRAPRLFVYERPPRGSRELTPRRFVFFIFSFFCVHERRLDKSAGGVRRFSAVGGADVNYDY